MRTKHQQSQSKGRVAKDKDDKFPRMELQSRGVFTAGSIMVVLVIDLKCKVCGPKTQAWQQVRNRGELVVYALFANIHFKNCL